MVWDLRNIKVQTNDIYIQSSLKEDTERQGIKGDNRGENRSLYVAGVCDWAVLV